MKSMFWMIAVTIFAFVLVGCDVNNSADQTKTPVFVDDPSKDPIYSPDIDNPGTGVPKK